MIGCRYGAVPIVRATGGLADTVAGPTSPAERPNGFTFAEPRDPAQVIDPDAAAGLLRETVLRAIDTFRGSPGEWARLVANGMRHDWSWEKSARKYLRWCEAAVSRRVALAARSA
jgi:starch synthase